MLSVRVIYGKNIQIKFKTLFFSSFLFIYFIMENNSLLFLHLGNIQTELF